MATKTKEKTPSPPVEYASAMDKLRDEMAKSQGKYVQVVGEYMTAYLLQHPEAEAAILSEGKTIAGSLKAMEAEARKVQQGNVAVLDDQTAFGIVLGYFGLKSEPDVLKTGENVLKTGENVLKTGENAPGTEKNVTAASDLFDLEALLGVM